MPSARSLIAVYMAGLAWKDVDEDTKFEVVKYLKAFMGRLRIKSTSIRELL